MSEPRYKTVARAVARACADAQWHDCETDESAPWRDFLEAVAPVCRDAGLALQALEMWEMWWNSLPLDEQVRNHEAAHAAITKTRGVLAAAEAQR